MTIHRIMSLVAMAFLWTGSQIPVYLFGELRLMDDPSAVILTKPRRYSTVHISRYRWGRSMDLVCTS